MCKVQYEGPVAAVRAFAGRCLAALILALFVASTALTAARGALEAYHDFCWGGSEFPDAARINVFSRRL